jgi:hypothetical protein
MEAIAVGIGLTQLAFGVWMAVLPAGFFDTAGGFGAENHHFIRDTSTISLAFGVAFLVASRRPSRHPPLLFAA